MPTATQDLFRAPTSGATPPPPLVAPVFTLPPQPTPALPAATGEALLYPPSPTSPCTSSLRFIQDVNFPDGTIVAPGQRITKTWLVENNGSCNWDLHYRLRFSGGISMGADTEQALYPARAGNQANLQIAFTSPEEPGVYRSEWRAYDPSGAIFGDTLYVQIAVQAP